MTVHCSIPVAVADSANCRPIRLPGFNSGLSIVKWSNIRTDGAATSHNEFPDVDIPLIRYAEMYLTRAEAKFRLSGDPQQARDDIKVLRDRAGASTPATITEQYIIDEWCREFYMEGRRRSDLISFWPFHRVMGTSGISRVV